MPTPQENKQEENKPGTPPKSGEQPPPAPNDKAAAAPGSDDDLDEFGYQKTKAAPEGDKEKAGGKPAEAAAKKPEKVEEPGTGYGDAPPKVDEAPAAESPPPAEAAKEGIEKDLEGLPEAVIKGAKTQAERLKLTPEQQKEFVASVKQDFNDRKAAFEKNQRDQQAIVTRQRQERNAAWDKELREDATYGGQKFSANLLRAENALAECLPRTKKMLTSGKEMVPPYLMRDLVDLWDRLYPERTVTQGDPVPPEGEKEDDKASSPLDFYQ